MFDCLLNYFTLLWIILYFMNLKITEVKHLIKNVIQKV